MKIELEVVEKITRTLVIDTDDYSISYVDTSWEQKVLDTANFINGIKDDYTQIMDDRSDEVEEHKERISVNISIPQN